MTLSAGTDITFTEDCAARFRAYGWHTIRVEDGNDLAAINFALTQARAGTQRPSLILIRTHIGYGSPEQDSYKAHGSPLGVDDVRRTKEKLNWPTEPAFLVPDAALAHCRKALERGARSEADWSDQLIVYARAYPELAVELKSRLSGELPAGCITAIPAFPRREGHRHARGLGKIMNAIAASYRRWSAARRISIHRR